MAYDDSLEIPTTNTQVSVTVFGQKVVGNLKALRDSLKHMEIEVFSPSVAVSASASVVRKMIHIPEEMAGMKLKYIFMFHAHIGTTGTTTVQIYNITQDANMLSTVISVDSGELTSKTAATPAVIDEDHAEVAADDILGILVPTKTTTAPYGLQITLGFGF